MHGWFVCRFVPADLGIFEQHLRPISFLVSRRIQIFNRKRVLCHTVFWLALIYEVFNILECNDWLGNVWNNVWNNARKCRIMVVFFRTYFPHITSSNVHRKHSPPAPKHSRTCMSPKNRPCGTLSTSLAPLRRPAQRDFIDLGYSWLPQFCFVFTGGYARKINAEKCILHLLHDPTFFALYPTRPESSFGALQRECKKNICSSRIYHFLLTRITFLHNTRHCFFGEFWT